MNTLFIGPLAGQAMEEAVRSSGVRPAEITRIDGDGLKIADLRRVIEKLPQLPVDGDAKLVVIQNADKLSPICQNALLKSLEEPPRFVGFALSAARSEPLLPTVLSRLTTVRAGGAEEDFEFEVKDFAAPLLRALDQRREPDIVAAALSLSKITRDQTRDLIDYLRQELMRSGDPARIGAADRLGDLHEMLPRNVGVGHICGGIAVIIAEATITN